jgi:hexosaminidase
MHITTTLLLITLFIIPVSAMNNRITTAGGEEQHRVRVVPQPQHVTVHNEPIRLTAGTRIVLGAGSGEAEEFLARYLRDELYEHTGLSLEIAGDEHAVTARDIFLGLRGRSKRADEAGGDILNEDMEREGYYLHSGEGGITVVAHTSAGLYYGGMTLLQLIVKEDDVVMLPSVTIQDYPVYRFRGISDDISRGQVSTPENFKEIIRRLARYKQNVYMPYLEDMFRFESHPLIGKNRGALTREEVEELDAFARAHHVEIIPIFQTLGHMENILLMPEYVDFAEFPGANCLDVSNEAIYDFLQELFDEIVPAFSSKYFHMAADESWDVGRGSSRKLVEKSDLAGVHAEHFRRVYSMLKEMGKEVIMYADIATGLGEAIPGHPEVLGQLPDDIMMVYWDYGVRTSYLDKASIFREAGQPLIVSPAVWNWHRIFPDNITAPVNIRNMARTGVEANAVGFINSGWGDYGGETLRELNWFGYAYGAEVSWSPAHDALERFMDDFLYDFYGSDDVRLTTVYTLLANLGRTFTNADLWRPPFMPPAGNRSWDLSSQFLLNFYQVKQDLATAERLLGEIDAGGITVRNRNHMDYLRFAIEKVEFFIAKVEGARDITQLGDLTGDDREPVRHAIEVCDSMIAKGERLQERFISLWLRTNTEANLHNLIEHYYQRELSYWREKKEELERGIVVTDQVSPSMFIYHPDATPYVSRGTRKPESYFRKTFTIDDIDAVEKVMVQTVGDTYLRIYVNGTEVGESYAKRALSLIVQRARTRFWDITGYLDTGENVIAVEARNYNHAGSAGLNWYSELTYRAGSREYLFSDETWKVHDKASGAWYTPSLNDKKWKQARAVDERVPLIDRPNFEHNRMSVIYDRVWTATLED